MFTAPAQEAPKSPFEELLPQEEVAQNSVEEITQAPQEVDDIFLNRIFPIDGLDNALNSLSKGRVMDALSFFLTHRGEFQDVYSQNEPTNPAFSLRKEVDNSLRMMQSVQAAPNSYNEADKKSSVDIFVRMLRHTARQKEEKEEKEKHER